MSLITDIARLAKEVRLLKERERLLAERTQLQRRAVYWKVFEAVCKHFNVSTDQLFADTRICADARQVAQAIICDLGASIHDAGMMFGRDHKTVLHARNAVQNKLTDKRFAKRYQAVLSELKP